MVPVVCNLRAFMKNNRQFYFCNGPMKRPPSSSSFFFTHIMLHEVQNYIQKYKKCWIYKRETE